MKNAFFFAMVLGLGSAMLFLMHGRLTSRVHKPQWDLELEPSASHPTHLRVEELPTCVGKDQCAVVYLTPEQARSRALVPFLQDAIERGEGNQRLGVAVFVGHGKHSKLLPFAQNFGLAGHVDAEKSISKLLRVRRLPAYYVLDKFGDIQALGEEARRLLLETLYAQDASAEGAETL
jgi:hypothetical protein